MQLLKKVVLGFSFKFQGYYRMWRWCWEPNFAYVHRYIQVLGFINYKYVKWYALVNHVIQTLFAAILKFVAAIEGRNE